jgi:Trypsin-like peptidase domain
MMLSEAIKRRIEAACVTFITPGGPGGRGFLVPGQLVLTAAHCVTYSAEGEMALGDDFIEVLQTPQGELKVRTAAVEPVADIAVLGALDAQSFGEEEEAFTTWCMQTPAIPLCMQELPIREPFPVYIYTHRGQWIEARATIIRGGVASVWLDVPGQIEGGTSGSPIVTERGEVIGIVSLVGSGPDETQCDGPQPRPTHALPVWVLQQIQVEQDSENGQEA